MSWNNNSLFKSIPYIQPATPEVHKVLQRVRTGDIVRVTIEGENIFKDYKVIRFNRTKSKLLRFDGEIERGYIHSINGKRLWNIETMDVPDYAYERVKNGEFEEIPNLAVNLLHGHRMSSISIIHENPRAKR